MEPNKSWTPRTIMIGGKVSGIKGVFVTALVFIYFYMFIWWKQETKL